MVSLRSFFHTLHFHQKNLRLMKRALFLSLCKMANSHCFIILRNSAYQWRRALKGTWREGRADEFNVWNQLSLELFCSHIFVQDYSFENIEKLASTPKNSRNFLVFHLPFLSKSPTWVNVKHIINVSSCICIVQFRRYFHYIIHAFGNMFYLLLLYYPTSAKYEQIFSCFMNHFSCLSYTDSFKKIFLHIALYHTIT